MRENSGNVNTMFGSIEVGRKEARRNRLIAVAMLIFGIGLCTTLRYAENFWIMIKPAYAIEHLMEHGAREGMHVQGKLPYIYDCFASRENMDSGRVEADYYALPCQDGFLIVKAAVKDQPAMERLLSETVEFLGGGLRPESVISIEGYVTKAQGRLPYLLGEYMISVGYTQEEVDAMKEPLMIVENAEAMRDAGIWFPVGIILQSAVVLAVAFCVFRSRRKRKEEAS